MNKYKGAPLQFILFGFVGVVSLGIDLGVSALLYYSLHTPVYFASAIGFLSAFFFNFPMNRKRVFHHSSIDRFTLHIQVIFYAILCLFNLFVTAILVDVMVNTLSIPIQYSKVFVALLIALWNFFIFKFYIFSKYKED